MSYSSLLAFAGMDITLVTILFITRRGILYIRIAENIQNLDTRSFALSSRTRVQSGLLNRRSFFSLVKTANYFRDITDVRQSFSINLQQVLLGNDYEQVTIFCQKSSW